MAHNTSVVFHDRTDESPAESYSLYIMSRTGIVLSCVGRMESGFVSQILGKPAQLYVSCHLNLKKSHEV